MTFKEIQELLKFINKSNLTEFKLKEGDFELSIRTSKYNKTQLKGTALTPPTPVLSVPTVQQPYTPSSAPVTTPAPAPAPTSIPEKAQEQAPLNKSSESSGSNAYLEIKSPMVGTFYRSPSTDKPAYVKVGDQVEVGAVVCIVEAMKIFNEIESEISGKIVKVLVEDAQPVEFDQALFLVDPNG